ncbi:MAG: carboxypeptidase regulatory-like domain-containing protein, partial [Verrucomicrobiota bacterium]
MDESTGVVRATVTNEAGEYVFNAVEPATYTVRAESPSFKRFERKGVVVATQQFLTVNMTLEVGSVSETINVTEEVPLMETANASNGQVIDRQKIVDLPNLGRNPFMMAKIAPNVVQAGDPRFNRMQDQSGSSQISIAGGPVRGNNYLIDGVPITATSNVAVIIPTLEAVQEIKIQANTYDAEMGRTGGGVFNTYLKSGSNDLHGSLFGYTRQTEWLANSFFNNATRIARPSTPQVNFGASFGGPILIPKLYNGKNKTFFWLGYERYRQNSGLTQLLATPTDLERAGDFSKSFTKAGALATIYDPFSGTARTAFPGNVIPANRLNPVGLAIASYFPKAASTPSYLGANDFTGLAILLDQATQETAKVDHELFSWWHTNLSYLHYKSREP